MFKKSSSWQKSGQKNSYRKLISSFLVSTRSKSLLGNFLWWRISARSQGGAGFCFAKTSAPPFDLASILHHKKFPAAFRPCTNQETQKYLFHTPKTYGKLPDKTRVVQKHGKSGARRARAISAKARPCPGPVPLYNKSLKSDKKIVLRYSLISDYLQSGCTTL